VTTCVYTVYPVTVGNLPDFYCETNKQTKITTQLDVDLSLRYFIDSFLKNVIGEVAKFHTSARDSSFFAVIGFDRTIETEAMKKLKKKVKNCQKLMKNCANGNPKKMYFGETYYGQVVLPIKNRSTLVQNNK